MLNRISEPAGLEACRLLFAYAKSALLGASGALPQAKPALFQHAGPQLYPLLGRIEQHRPGFVSGQLAEKLPKILRQVAAANIMRLEFVLPVVQAFQDAGIAFCFLKGIHHLAVLYRDPALRAMTDVDMLVPLDHLAMAHRILLKLGFAPIQPDTSSMAHAVAYRGPSGTLDLHVRLTRRGMHAVSVERLLEEAAPAEFLETPLRILSPVGAAVAHALLLGRHAFAPYDLGALRCIELALLCHLAAERFSAVERLLCDFKASRILLWVRQLRQALTTTGEVSQPNQAVFALNPPASSGSRVAAMFRLARFQSSSLGGLRYLLLETLTTGVRAFTMRRLGRLVPRHREERLGRTAAALCEPLR